MRWRYSQHLFAGYAETCLARDELAKAEQWTDQCLDLATRTDSKKYLARAWRLKAGLDLARSQSEDAEEALLKALAYAEQIGNPTQLWHTRLALGRLYGDSGRGDQFRAMALAARKGLDHMAASLTVAPLRAAFEKSFVIREAYERTEVD
jgi:tetratricopeptide (TPR) repeat protein